MLCFTSIVEFIAACPLCLHGSAATIASCHAQSTNSPIATCVNFGLQIPQISENSRQVGKCHFTTKTISTMTKTMVQIRLNSDERLPS